MMPQKRPYVAKVALVRSFPEERYFTEGVPLEVEPKERAQRSDRYIQSSAACVRRSLGEVQEVPLKVREWQEE